MDGVQSAEKDSTTDLDMSGIGLHEPRNRSSIEVNRKSKSLVFTEVLYHE